MKNRTKLIGIGVSAAALGTLLAVSVGARTPFTEAQLADQEKQLLELVDKGRDLWHGGLPSGNGLACGNCHPDAAAANPQTFPKFAAQINDVVPYREMVNWCIVHPMDGKAIDVSGKDMTALEAYSFYLHRGEKIAPGLASKQTTPIAVKSGVGYSKTPSGLGVDK